MSSPRLASPIKLGLAVNPEPHPVPVRGLVVCEHEIKLLHDLLVPFEYGTAHPVHAEHQTGGHPKWPQQDEHQADDIEKRVRCRLAVNCIVLQS